MRQRIWAVMQKEFIQTFRDRSTLVMLLAMPIIQLLLFGYAISMSVDHVPTIVSDQSHDSASLAYVNAMAASSYFDITEYAASQAEVMQAIDAGRVQAGIVIPPDFSASVERGDAQVLFLVDGSDLFTSQSAYNAASSIAQAHATEVLMTRMERSGLVAKGQSLLPLDARVRVLYNPNMDDLWFLIPGLAAMLLQTQSIILTTAAVVRERETGTIEQILVTPIRPTELMLGKIAPNILIAMFNMLSIMAAGVFWFRVPFQGNFLLFCGLAFLYVFSGTALGLVVSTVSQNQRQSQQLVISILLVGMVLGGSMFPRYAMPAGIRIVANLFPLTYFIPISRGIMTKGLGVEFLWNSIVPLLIYIVVTVSLAARMFKQGLD
ncbi:MAG: ABC transporter permease [Chloroflexota bacterium]